MRRGVGMAVTAALLWTAPAVLVLAAPAAWAETATSWPEPYRYPSSRTPAAPATPVAEPERGRPPGYLGVPDAGPQPPPGPGGNAPGAREQRSAFPPRPDQLPPREGDDRRMPPDRQALPRSREPGFVPPTSVQGGLGRAPGDVERSELAPVMGTDGTRLPHDVWRGLNVAEIETLLTGLTLPPRSGALHDLWRRLMTTQAPEPSGGKTRTHFAALRLEALYRSGLLEAMVPAASEVSGPEGDVVLDVQRAKALLGLGQRDKACERSRATTYKGDVPAAIAQDALLLVAYCAALGGNPAAASLSIDLAREQRMEAPLAFAIIDHLASGAKEPPKLAIPKDVGLIDYRLMELAGLARGTRLLERAEPALILALAGDGEADPKTRIEAAEDAARLHALSPEALAKLYLSIEVTGGAPAALAGTRGDAPLRRAALAQAVRSERAPAAKARHMQSLLHEARQQTLYLPVARLLAEDLKSLPQSREMAFFAETAVEIALAGDDPAAAVGWALLGSQADRGGRGDALLHWLTLIDIASPGAAVPRGSGLKMTEELARKGRFAPEVLHRLVTVLDALDYDIPIPLWDLASRTPQPTKGHLPETGVLAQLKAAAEERRFAATVLLVLRTLGPDGGEGAHMIALGDSIRALRKAGLEADARRLGMEALFATWPRGSTQ